MTKEAYETRLWKQIEILKKFGWEPDQQPQVPFEEALVASNVEEEENVHIEGDEWEDYDIVTYTFGDQNRAYLRGQFTFHKVR